MGREVCWMKRMRVTGGIVDASSQPHSLYMHCHWNLKREGIYKGRGADSIGSALTTTSPTWGSECPTSKMSDRLATASTIWLRLILTLSCETEIAIHMIISGLMLGGRRWEGEVEKERDRVR